MNLNCAWLEPFVKAKEHKQVPIPSRLNLTPLTRHDFLQVAAAEASRDLQAGSHARVVASVRKKGGYGGSTSSSLRRTRCTEIRGLRSARAPRTFVASSSRLVVSLYSQGVTVERTSCATLQMGAALKKLRIS